MYRGLLVFSKAFGESTTMYKARVTRGVVFGYDDGNARVREPFDREPHATSRANLASARPLWGIPSAQPTSTCASGCPHESTESSYQIYLVARELESVQRHTGDVHVDDNHVTE